MTNRDTEQPRLGEVLIAAGAVTESQLKLALKEQSGWDSPLGMTLVRLGFLDEATLVRALASQLNMPVLALGGKRINKEILELIPIATVEKYRCLPLILNEDGGKRVLYLGLADPTDNAAIEEISGEIGMAVQPVLVAPTELDESIHRHYHWDSIGSTSQDPNTVSNPAPIQKASNEQPSLPSLAGATAPFSSGDGQGAPMEKPGLGKFVDPNVGMESADAVGTVGPLTDDSELSIPESFVEHEPGMDSEPEIPEVLEFAEPVPGVEQPQTGTQQPQPAAMGGSDPMLRAIAQLLIEKGVFTRDELVDRLRSVSQEDT